MIAVLLVIAGFGLVWLGNRVYWYWDGPGEFLLRNAIFAWALMIAGAYTIGCGFNLLLPY